MVRMQLMWERARKNTQGLCECKECYPLVPSCAVCDKQCSMDERCPLCLQWLHPECATALCERVDIENLAEEAAKDIDVDLPDIFTLPVA